MMPFASLRTVAPALLLITLAGCSVYTRQDGPAPVESRPTEPAAPTQPAPAPEPEQPLYPDAAPADPNVSAAYGPLLKKAEAAAAGGDYQQALALLERAQRVDPDSAEIYLAMARTYAAKGDLAQARATAERGMLYCRSELECAQLRQLTRAF